MIRLASICLASVLLIASIVPASVLAQDANDSWSDPQNLSHSGFSKNLAFVIGSDGIGHAVWENDLGNYMYTRLDGDKWSVPTATELGRIFNPPAATGSRRTPATNADEDDPKPVFVAGPGDDIFAFWITAQGKLLTSRVKNQSFEEFAAWAPPQVAAPNVVAFAVAIDARGELHLVYQSAADESTNPAGIYYTRSKNGGATWGVAALVYESPYFRTLEEGGASLSVATAETEDVPRVYVAWDNRRRKQVFLAQSTDGGQNWAETMLVDGPTADTSLDAPFNIRVGVQKNSVVLVWQNGQPEGGCSQLFQFSNDQGATWSTPQVMIENLLGCTPANAFVPKLATDTDGPAYFLTETKSQTFLSMWDGVQWSQAEAQPMLSGFREPEIFSEVLFACHQTALSGERLYVVGCDEGDGGDVWATSRDLGAKTTGLKPPAWSPVLPITNDKLQVEAVELVTTEDGLIHSFVSQRKDPIVYYTYWDGEVWSRIASVLKLPDGEAGLPAIAAGPGNGLFLVVPNNRGALYFSRTTSEGAVTASGWSTLKRLENGHDGKIGSADVARDSAGTVFMAYSIPVNDDRGVYLVLSKDDGATWTEPVQLFDGAAAGFDFVGPPSLLASENGSLHVMWNVQSIEGDGSPQPIALYYARSEDGGHIFGNAEMLLDEPVVWREIVSDGDGQMHLLWQEENTLTTLWDQVSLDGGHTWQYPHGLPVNARLAALTRDPAGRLHVLHVGAGVLGQWDWNGNAWKSESPLGLPLTSQEENSVDLLVAAVNKQGKMMVVLAKPSSPGDGLAKTLLYSTRALELPRNQTELEDAPTSTPSAPTSAPPTPTPQHSSTSTAALEPQVTNSPVQLDGNASSSRISPFTLALVPVALLLLGVLGIMIRQVVRAKDR